MAAGGAQFIFKMKQQGSITDDYIDRVFLQHHSNLKSLPWISSRNCAVNSGHQPEDIRGNTGCGIPIVPKISHSDCPQKELERPVGDPLGLIRAFLLLKAYFKKDERVQKSKKKAED